MENAPEKTRKGNQALETAVESLRARAAKLDARVEAEESAAAAQGGDDASSGGGTRGDGGDVGARAGRRGGARARGG